VTGPDHVVHLHRLRALCDAVIVGAGTIERDDPLLTVRHVEGDNPLRVIIDPRRRLGTRARVFADDARTLLIYGDDAPSGASHGAADVVTLPVRGGRLDLGALLAELRARLPRGVRRRRRRDGVELRRSGTARPAADRDRTARDRQRPSRSLSARARSDRRVPAARASRVHDGQRRAVRLRFARDRFRARIGVGRVEPRGLSLAPA